MAMNEELISIQIEKGIGVGTVLIGKRTDCFYSKNERASRVLRVQDFVYVCVCVCAVSYTHLTLPTSVYV